MEIIEVKSQWTKRIALQRFLPAEIKQEIKTLLKVQKANAGTDIYKRIKTKLITLFGAKPEDSYNRAKNRVMTGKPSQLGEALVDDICQDCTVKLAAGCCAKVVWGMYREAIPVVIRNHIAQLQFNKDTYQNIFTISDQIFDSNQLTQPEQGNSVASVSASTANSSSSEPEVAAMRPQRRNRNQNRGSGGNSNSGGNSRNSNQNQAGASKGQNKPQEAGNKGPKHPTAKGDKNKLCKVHYKWGENGNYCAAPWQCPMKDIFKGPQ